MNILDYRVGLAVASAPARLEVSPYEDHTFISGLIREALLQAGLGQTNPDRPLADLIEPGMTVLLKPNWVLHYNQSGQGMDCMVTHPNFILAVLQEVLAAQPGRVIIGDAPIQLCQFDTLINSSWKQKVEQIATCPVDIIDFRRAVAETNNLALGINQNVRDEHHYSLFDLGEDSLLEPLSSPVGRFRVTNYNPDELSRTHRPGRHQYLLCQEAFDADVILNLPKLKTHRKAGITAALKNLVGLNGNKDYLPHHRVGGTALGGDCYPSVSPLKRLAEFCLDNANRAIGTRRYQHWYKAISYLMDWQQKIGDTEIEGGWYGNDTVWRMVLDLNRLLIYGRADGTLADTPLRRIYSLTDAIVAGEGEGPLAPSPKYLGVVTFAFASAYADLVHASLMQFNWENIPLIQEAFGKFSYALTKHSPEDCQIHLNNQIVSLKEVATKVGIQFQPPQGWKGHIDSNAVPI